MLDLDVLGTVKGLVIAGFVVTTVFATAGYLSGGLFIATEIYAIAFIQFGYITYLKPYPKPISPTTSLAIMWTGILVFSYLASLAVSIAFALSLILVAVVGSAAHKLLFKHQRRRTYG